MLLLENKLPLNIRELACFMILNMIYVIIVGGNLTFVGLLLYLFVYFIIIRKSHQESVITRHSFAVSSREF